MNAFVKPLAMQFHPAWLAMLVGAGLILSGCARWPTKPSAAAWGEVPISDARTSAPGADRDGDGISDDRERALRSDPDLRDSDSDGFDDGFEDRLAPFGFDAVRPDADRDRDGLTDARETALRTNPAAPDSDGDGWSDFDEVLNAGFGYDPRSASVDADFDGLVDALEQRLGSSPAKVDSNSDGISDFQAHAASQPPNGPPLKNGLDELVGAPYSQAMADALGRMRGGGRFPAALAEELPYPIVTATLPAQGLQPSAALMQRAVANPHHSPGVYPPYLEIEQALSALAQQYDGNPRANIVRLFHWTGQTQDNCNQDNHPGRRIYAVKISANPDTNEQEPELAFFGVHHGRELISGAATMQLLRTLTDGYGSDPLVSKLVDTRETWVIPVVNPNGYDRAAVDQLTWRKNTRWEKGQVINCGTDLNRNYSFDHVTNFAPAQRALLPNVGNTGVNTATGALEIDSETYPGKWPFSEVETQAVRGLANSVFASRQKEVDGLVCSLSWHAYSGLVMHPMSHAPIAPDIGLEPADVAPLAALTKSLATATGYADLQDDFPTTPNVSGCGLGGYASYGDASDWLYKHFRTRALTIEAYSKSERGGTCPVSGVSVYSPFDPALRDAVAANNVRAALALLQECTQP